MLIGLAHQLMMPDVALPGADDEPPVTGAVLLPVPLLLLLLTAAAAGYGERPDRSSQGGQLPAPQPPRRIFHRSLSCH